MLNGDAHMALYFLNILLRKFFSGYWKIKSQVFNGLK